MSAQSDAARLVALADVARLAGVSRQRIHQLAMKPGFPRPIGVFRTHPLYRRDTIDHWLEATNRRRSEHQAALDTVGHVKQDADASSDADMTRRVRDSSEHSGC
jgi:predicted DNA-binding transcriptional regulator AlpA